MFGKLLKYEFRYTARIFPIVYIALLASAGVARLMYYITENLSIMAIPSVLFSVLYVLFAFATFILAYIVLIVRFYKNTIGDEGYLTFTLPVKTWQTVLSKLITSVVWLFASIVAVAASVVILVAGSDFINTVKGLFARLGELLSGYGVTAQFILFAVLMLVLILLSLSAGISMLYCAMSLGQLFSGHKIIGSIAAYFGLSFANQLVMGILMAILNYSTPAFANVFNNDTFFDTLGSANIVLTICIAVYVLLAATYFFISNHVLTKKLNLD